MKQPVLFIFSNFIGHLHRCIGLINHRFPDQQAILFTYGKPKIDLKSHPIQSIESSAQSLSAILQKAFKLGSASEEIHSDLDLIKRELLGLIDTYHPECIVVDEHCSEIILFFLKEYDPSKIVISSASFPNSPNTNCPPPTEYAFPGKESYLLWEKYVQERKQDPYLSYKQSFFLEYFSDQHLPNKYSINFFYEGHPVFNRICRWFPVPQALDFPNNLINNWEKFIGPIIQIDKKEAIDHLVLFFVRKAKSEVGNKLIYVSFGTVLDPKITDFDELKRIFLNLIDLGKSKPNIYLFLQIPHLLVQELKPKSINVHIRVHFPQLFLLKNCDLFLSHGGTNSILEALALRKKLVVFPMVKYFSTAGNCARLVYHGLAKSAKNYSLEEILEF